MHTEAREAIESLELWLRAIIDVQLTKEYGKNYFSAKDNKGQSIIKSSIVKEVEDRFSNNNNRFSRKVDALLLDEESAIICNPKLYQKLFKNIFTDSFPPGNEMLRTLFNQLVPIRNKLSHSNNISQREYEKVICYSHDIVDAIKSHNKRENMEKEYNVPSIINFQDSLGNKVYSNQFNRIRPSTPFCGVDLIKNHTLYPHDLLTLEVNVDDSFSEEEYEVSWSYIDGSNITKLKTVVGKKTSIKIQEHHIREKFQIECYIKSNKIWHRFGGYDDMLRVFYKILPIRN